MTPDPRRALFDLLERSAGDVFPGCVALVWRAGATLYHEAHGSFATHDASPELHRGVTRDSVYDLASLTKVLATTTLTAIAVSEGLLGLTTPVPAPWSQACPGAQLRHLLAHCAGLAAHREYFADLRPPGGRADAANSVIQRVCNTPPEYPLATRAIYSDLGFIILGAWLEMVLGAPLDQAFANRVAWPLGLDGGPVPRLGFHRLQAARGPSAAQQGLVVPTEVYDPALHPNGEPTWFRCRRPVTVAHYEVHDDNAFVMGGVAGHAGLFGTAAAVLEVAHAWLTGGLPGLGDPVRRAFLTHLSEVPGSTRRLGWDSPNPDGSGAAGDALSPRAAGHTGYTGTSVWLDETPPDDRGPIIAVLLSNRVHPTRDNPKLAALRPLFHRAAVAL